MHGLPPLTSLQFMMLSVIDGTVNISGFKVRQAMAKAGVKLNGPAFYQAMRRIETAGLVNSHYDNRIENGKRERGHRVHIRECRYRLTNVGLNALIRTREFYRSR